jgi:hypothetical protein
MLLTLKISLLRTEVVKKLLRSCKNIVNVSDKQVDTPLYPYLI